MVRLDCVKSEIWCSISDLFLKREYFKSIGGKQIDLIWASVGYPVGHEGGSLPQEFHWNSMTTQWGSND